VIAQQAPQSQSDQSKPAHGIIRKPPPKSAPPAKRVEEPAKIKPVASIEAVAAAIARR